MENYIGLHKTQLNTPVLVIDKEKLLHNIKAMQSFARSRNINLRPHAKTHKCSHIAKLQIEAGCIGICVTKVSEAYELAKNNIKGILITSPIASDNKMQMLIDVLKIAPDTILVIDNIDTANRLNKLLIQNNKTLNALLDIDGGNARTGVGFDQAIITARAINNLSNINFRGIQCYSGHIQHIKNIIQRGKVSTEILHKAGKIKQALIAEGIDCRMQTGSGTGTFSIDATVEAVTEIQPGSYTVMDQEYSEIEFGEIRFLNAMTMLCSVISANHKTHITVDAGTKAMYKVDTKPHIISHPHLIYDWAGFGDEHAKITSIDHTKLPGLGEVIELVVGHCDPTINLFDKFFVTENDIVIDCWNIDLRGKCQ